MMPPNDVDQPSNVARGKAVQSLAWLLIKADRASREVVLRRLNRNEYQNTVCDLFNIQIDVDRLLPNDAAKQGFDTGELTAKPMSNPMWRSHRSRSTRAHRSKRRCGADSRD